MRNERENCRSRIIFMVLVILATSFVIFKVNRESSVLQAQVLTENVSSTSQEDENISSETLSQDETVDSTTTTSMAITENVEEKSEILRSSDVVITIASTDNNINNTPQVPSVSTNSSETRVVIYPNSTTEEFVERIGEKAQEVASRYDLYASVMIAQAILESSSGNSSLSREPNYNLFGIKGTYLGSGVSFSTQEDNGSGSLYTVISSFRKYPSYEESLTDYAELLQNDFYSGARKSQTVSYQEATQYLTGRYATDTSYYLKLNGLITAYSLEKYDAPVSEGKSILPSETIEEKKSVSIPIIEESPYGASITVKQKKNTDKKNVKVTAQTPANSVLANSTTKGITGDLE